MHARQFKKTLSPKASKLISSNQSAHAAKLLAMANIADTKQNAVQLVKQVHDIESRGIDVNGQHYNGKVIIIMDMKGIVQGLGLELKISGAFGTNHCCQAWRAADFFARRAYPCD